MDSAVHVMSPSHSAAPDSQDEEMPLDKEAPGARPNCKRKSSSDTKALEWMPSHLTSPLPRCRQTFPILSRVFMHQICLGDEKNFPPLLSLMDKPLSFIRNWTV